MAKRAGKLSEPELKILKSEVFWEQLGYLSDELGDPGRYFPFLKSKVYLCDFEPCSVMSFIKVDSPCGVNKDT